MVLSYAIMGWVDGKNESSGSNETAMKINTIKQYLKLTNLLNRQVAVIALQPLMPKTRPKVKCTLLQRVYFTLGIAQLKLAQRGPPLTAAGFNPVAKVCPKNGNASIAKFALTFWQ